MIVVVNIDHGQIYGFNNIDDYKTFVRKNIHEDRSVWDDQIHELGAEGGEITTENQLDLFDFKCQIQDVLLRGEYYDLTR
jgi:hypothetical protein